MCGEGAGWIGDDAGKIWWGSGGGSWSGISGGCGGGWPEKRWQMMGGAAPNRACSSSGSFVKNGG